MPGHGFLPIPVGHILSCHAPRLRGIQYSSRRKRGNHDKNFLIDGYYIARLRGR
jgi:hypothetical protein